MGVDVGNLQVIDADVILEHCPITIPRRYILKSSDMVFIFHAISYIVCDSRSIM